jgi:diaminopimelate epimerase
VALNLSNAVLKAIPFTKASGCGNDFIIIDSLHAPRDIAGFTRRICERHNGVGADGVEWLYPPAKGADINARLINADGTDAEISGNGTRCVAAYYVARHFAESVRIQTGAGIKTCRVISKNASAYEFETEMGHPEVFEELSFQLSSGAVRGLRISMGNPQFVVFVEDFDFDWQKMGAEIQAQSNFSQGTNVDFVRILADHQIESRFFERGVGETQSSGTGSSASAVAAIATGRAKSPVAVSAEGGTQVVTWQRDGNLMLQGPAQLICVGEFFV